MKRRTPEGMQRRFFAAAGRAIHLAWPVLSTILGIQVVLGQMIGLIEGWSVGDALYFTFTTGLTVGYGDIVPRNVWARALAILIGFTGLFLTGVIAGIAVYAMNVAIGDRDSG